MPSDLGVFPFGRPNTARRMRPAADGPAQVTVVGVYPSAWHVRWSSPEHLRDRVRTGGVSALAVDVEPEVFWNGDGSDFPSRLATWREQTGFIVGDEPGAHGTLTAGSPATNGSSGRKVEGRYLAALRVKPEQAAFTDVCPVFFTKYGGGKRRPQGTAIEQEYNPIAADIGRPPASLPARPRVKDLVRRAVEEYGAGLVSDLERVNAPLLVTLGEEVLQTLRRLPQLAAVPPAGSLPELYDAGRYGTEGTVMLNGRPVRWLPLAHPGLLYGDRTPDASQTPSRSRGRDWNSVHSRWERHLNRDTP